MTITEVAMRYYVRMTAVIVIALCVALAANYYLLITLNKLETMH